MQHINDMGWFTFIASLCSIIGAVISITEARKAKRSAEAAESAKKSVMDRHHIKEYDALVKLSQSVNKILVERKSKGENIEGRTLSDDAIKIDNFISKVNEEQNTITENNNREIVKTAIKSMTESLKEYHPQSTNIKSASANMLDHLRKIVSVVKEENQIKEYR